MKSTASALVLLLAGAFVSAAEEYPELITGMKMTAATMDSLRKMEKKIGTPAVRAAERLGGVYELMIPFFRQRDAKDAVKLAEQGKAAAAQLASAAFGEDADRAEAAFQSLTGTWKSCHEAHREKLESGKYKIK